MALATLNDDDEMQEHEYSKHQILIQEIWHFDVPCQ
jgi:hypothetical protein